MQIPAERLTWTDNALRAEFSSTGGPVTCIIPRATIHCLPTYADLLGWEIERYKAEILQRLAPAIRRKIAAGALHRKGAALILILAPGDIEAADAVRPLRLRSGAA